MTLNLTIPQQNHSDFTPRITVIGVGGGGTNAVDNMIHSQLQGVEFVVANTDAQQLSHSSADRRIQLGPHLTQGLGAGAKPEIGRAAAEEACDELSRHLDGAHMVFITAGMGGGTGTGAAPVIARMARERGILTVGVVTKPFTFEGHRRAKSAEAGIAELQQFVDTLIIIPNQNLFRLANERTSWKDAFKMADNVLYMGVRGVTDLMMAPGLVNLDFADIRTIMAEMGKAMMGTGEAEGENRAVAAAEDAISNPLLEDTSMSGAQGLLINITGGEDLTLFEVDQAANRIREEVAEDANIIFGSAIDTSLNGRIRVSVVATGIDNPPGGHPKTHQVPPQAEAPAPQAAAPDAQAAPAPAAAGVAAQAATQPPQPAAPVGQPATAAPQPRPAAPQAPSPNAVPPHVAQAQRAGSPRSPLFTESAKPAAPEPQPAPRSLFGIVTGALRRHSTPAAPEPAPRTEPAVQPQPSQPSQPSAQNTGGNPAPDDGGLDIPAFLRRRSP
ncbi:cell division protein FtsZ [Komagataeibacter oboediens]|uniref:cell division protein FtsZ n=1 Tax=Komagataeibacter oboediens TaxID=65958 RepID=UPI0019049861|nr:cell division protein FtsZ [Komagataeibacter oboediens]GCE79488.1 cell division protein FtsZ [Komagataeibacter oboediens]